MAEEKKEALQQRTAPTEEQDRKVYLAGGRSLTVQDEVIEFHSPSGQLELRVRLTDEGPVLVMESVKIALKAAESVTVACKTFEVQASDSVLLKSAGELRVEAEKEMKITSTDDVRVRGKLIHLN